MAERWVNVGGLDVNIVESAGADELGWLKRLFSGVEERGPVGSSFADSCAFSNGSGGMKEVAPLEVWCLCKPSMWSGSGEGIRANGPRSGLSVGGESYEFERCRPND